MSSRQRPVLAPTTQAEPPIARRAWAPRFTRAARTGLTSYRIALGCLLLLALAFYLWTAASSIPFDFNSADADPYNLLTSGFLHGHTYMELRPPAALLALHDPYAPAQNAAYAAAYHDLALYKGHFYSQWGPTPVLTLFAPFRITGLAMSESFAVALYGFVGLLCAVLLLHVLVARLVPGTPRWVTLVSSVGLTLTNAVPFMARRPVQYEVAISCGYCFEMAGLLLVISAVLAPGPRLNRMAFGSLCLGLAIGGRPEMGLGGSVALAAALWEIRRRSGSFLPRRGDRSYRVLTYALAPFVVCGLLLALYNQVRFGAPTEFGDRYQLSSFDQTKATFFSLSYIIPGLTTYLLVPARFSLIFPHAFLQTAAQGLVTLPHGYVGSSTGPAGVPPEPTAGVLATMPITVLLLGLPLAWRLRRGPARRTVLAAAGLTVLGLVVVTVLSWANLATTERYEVDFVTLLLIPAFLLWALLLARYRRGTMPRRVWASLGVLLTVFGAAVGTAVSFTGYSNLLQVGHPAVFDSLEDVTGPLATLATMIRGRAELVGAEGAVTNSGPSGVTEAGATAWLGTDPLTLVVVSPGTRRLAVTANVTAGPGAPPPSAQTIQVRSPGRQPVAVPVISRGVRLPIALHWGLNRIRLTLSGTPTSPVELQLADLQLAR